MLAATRQAEISRLVEQFGSVRVADLAVQFGVTEETIRRDLDQLQSEGRLRRIHGGAVALRRGTGYEGSFAERAVRNLAAKQAIARQAVQLIQERDTLLLDASTTVLQVAKQLPDCELTVVTNSAQVIMELANRPHLTLVGLGGQVRPNSFSFVGPVAERTLQSYRVDRLFLSCKGLSLEGIFESNEMEGHLKQLMMARANQVILLADSAKINQTAFMLMSDLRQIDVLITDSLAPSDFTQAVAELGVDVIVVPEK